LAFHGSVGGLFEGGDNLPVFPLDILLDGLEVLAGKFVGKSEERLILIIL